MMHLKFSSFPEYSYFIPDTARSTTESTQSITVVSFPASLSKNHLYFINTYSQAYPSDLNIASHIPMISIKALSLSLEVPDPHDDFAISNMLSAQSNTIFPLMLYLSYLNKLACFSSICAKIPPVALFTAL